MRRLLLGETSVVFGGYIVQLVLTFITGIIIARLLGPAGYGVLNILRGIFLAILTFSSLGLEVGLLRVCGIMPANDPKTIGLLFRLRFLTAALNFVIFLVAMGVEVLFLRQIYTFEGFGTLFAITMIALPIQSDMNVVSAIYKSYGSARTYSLLSMYLQAVFRIVAIGILFFVSGGIKAVVIINVAQIALSWSALFVHTHFSKAKLPQLEIRGMFSRAVNAIFFESWRDVWSVLQFSLWMTMSAFVMGVMRSSDTLVLGAFVPAATVGAYSALNTVAQLVQMFPSAASQSLGPRVARFYSEGDLPAIRREMGRYIHIASIISSFIFAGIAIFGPDLKLIFGDKFIFDPVVCFILPLSYVFSATLAPTGFALSMTGRHRAEFLILLFGCLTLVALCWALIPSYGQIGAASAVALGFGATNVIRFSYVSKVLGFIPGHPRDILPPVLAFAIAYACRTTELTLTSASLGSTFVTCVVYTAIFATITYFALLRLDDHPFARKG